ncbi:MAG: hypothetical protein EPN43_04780 [Jatrophihabitans sp.]|nr:MAG: hypothetical protein EPN43_04780 [Jatrophihabitans sp.]
MGVTAQVSSGHVSTGHSAAALLERAARRALLAPSIHNTQPWRFVLTGDALEIRADPSRRLDVLDPRGRQLVISCGCALLHARITLQAAGHEPVVHRFPNPQDPELVARVEVGPVGTFPGSGSLDHAIDQRRTNRRQFIGDPLPQQLILHLQWIAHTEGAVLVPAVSPEAVAAVADTSAFADDIEMADAGYLAEIAAWTTDDPRRCDGVQMASVPRNGGGSSEGPMVREFDLDGLGWLPTPARETNRQTLLLLCARGDDERTWLRTGEALERIWLTLTDAGFSASPLTQAVEVRSAHRMLQERLGLSAIPQILLRAGQAPQAAASRRRPAREVITTRPATTADPTPQGGTP